MEFRILGSLEVIHDGASIPVRGRIQPRLLAVLLLEAPHVVPLSKLVDAAWDDAPPATARRQVQNAISALRRAFGDRGGEILTPTGDGYRIRSTESMVDLHRFQAATSRARTLSRSGRHTEALHSLHEALALWRGPALAGITGRLIESGAHQLDEAHLTATEHRISLELRFGRHAPIIGELQELLFHNPYRQRLAEHLMLALHRDGRTAEALNLYQTIQTRLSEDLGIDAGRPLRELYTAILREDPALNVAPSAPAVAEPPTTDDTASPDTIELPADPADFIGRQEQLRRLDELRADNGNLAVLSTITGAGGVGKTALAVRWAHRVGKEFPDGQLYINLRGFGTADPLPAHQALERFIRALGHPDLDIPDETDDAAALYRSLLAGRRALVILDNARDIGQVRPLLPGTDCFTIVTSRNRLDSLTALNDARPINLVSLPRAEPRELLAKLAPAKRLPADRSRQAVPA